MFKVGKLEDLDNINIKINNIVRTLYNEESNNHISYNTLSFDINNDIYGFSFSLNCKLDKLLELEYGTTIDFKKYLLLDDVKFTYKEITDVKPKYDITINRYMNNKYVVLINIFSNISSDNDDSLYASIIEFDFNLDDYI